MAENEGDIMNNDGSDAGSGGEGEGVFGGERVGEPGGGGGSAAQGEEAAGADPAGLDQQGEGGGRKRPGDWNPNEHSGGGGGEVY